MQKSLRILLVAALIGLGWWGWRAFFPSPERVIRSRLATLAACASFDRNQGTVQRALKVQKAIGFFTTDVVIDFESRGFDSININGRDELQQDALAMTRYDAVALEFLDVNITFGPSNQTAIANLTARATVDGQPDYLVQEFNFMLKKVDGRWLIYRIDSVKTLSNGPLRPYAGVSSHRSSFTI